LKVRQPKETQMSKGLVFWLIMILVLFFWGWSRPWTGDRWAAGMSLITFALFFLLGWQVFGFVIR